MMPSAFKKKTKKQEPDFGIKIWLRCPEFLVRVIDQNDLEPDFFCKYLIQYLCYSLLESEAEEVQNGGGKEEGKGEMQSQKVSSNSTEVHADVCYKMLLHTDVDAAKNKEKEGKTNRKCCYIFF